MVTIPSGPGAELKPAGILGKFGTGPICFYRPGARLCGDQKQKGGALGRQDRSCGWVDALGWMRSDGPGNLACFIRSFKLEENGSILRDVDENGAESFADLAQDIRRISSGIGEVTQVELRAQMKA